MTRTNKMLEEFRDYFLRNYPEGTVIGDPNWHVEKLFVAVARALGKKKLSVGAMTKKMRAMERKIQTLEAELKKEKHHESEASNTVVY